MLSRRSAKAIADTYQQRFTGYALSGNSTASGTKFDYRADELYDFLYAYDFDSWLLNAIKKSHVGTSGAWWNS